MTSQQPRGINKEDMERAIEAYSGTGDFLKKILQGETRKKVENFLATQDQKMAGLPFPYNPAGLPEDVYQATQRQYGKTDVFGPYTTDDARLIQQYFGGKGKV